MDNIFSRYTLDSNNDDPEKSYKTADEIKKDVEDTITQNKIVVFSKSWCPYCKKVINLLRALDVGTILILHLDTLNQSVGNKIQEILHEKTGQKTVPNVFINKTHVGGCSDVEQKLTNGTLYEILDGTYQTYVYDLIVIGGGSGGLAAAKEAANYGVKVAVCDFIVPTPLGTTWGLGGTCVNVGCIPKKLMHKASILSEDLTTANYFGWTIDKGSHDWGVLVTNVQNYIKSLNWNYRKELKQKDISYINAYASFLDKHTIQVKKKDGTLSTITSQNFIIAVGGRPHYPNFPGAKEFCITSDDLFSLPNHPGKTLIIGASYVALECAGFLKSLGSDCTVMVRSILLRGFDQDMAEKIGKHMESVGINFVRSCVVTNIVCLSETSHSLKCTGSYIDGSPFEDVYDTVLLAVGRNACTSDIGLENIGLSTNPRNFKIIVNESDQTSVKTIFAIGDVADGKLELTPVAIQAGKLLAKRLFNNGKLLTDYQCIPTTVFTPLEYGCVGLTEETAIENHGRDIVVFHNIFRPLEFALSALHKDFCYAKLICVKSKEDLKVVGFHILGPNAGEITQGFALAIKLGVTKAQFDDLIGIHPTCAEVFTTLSITKSSGEDIGKETC